MSSITPALTAESVPEQHAARAHVHMAPLDGVRGLAIILVLIGHLTDSVMSEFQIYFTGLGVGQLGWIGVDLFFVLSGFLITGILYDAKDGASYFKTFYARRALRIFPLYYTAIIVVFILAALFPILNLFGDGNPAWLLIYMTNFIGSEHGGDPFGVLTHFWSLAVEEHYYLFWPTIVFLLNRRALMAVAACAIVVAFIVRCMSINDAGEMTYAGYMWTFARMDALAAGSMIALAARGPGGIEALRKPAFYIAPLAAAAFIGLVIWRHAYYYTDPIVGTVGISVLWALFGSLLVLSLTWKPASTFTSHSTLRWFGKYSYGIYVWHPIIFILFVHTDWARSWRTGNLLIDMPMQFGIAAAVLGAVTLTSWHLMEKQFLKLKRHFE
jgi:peptidoglycan/LPS O-acetylase OafA/YrhL